MTFMSQIMNRKRGNGLLNAHNLALIADLLKQARSIANYLLIGQDRRIQLHIYSCIRTNCSLIFCIIIIISDF